MSSLVSSLGAASNTSRLVATTCARRVTVLWSHVPFVVDLQTAQSTDTSEAVVRECKCTQYTTVHVTSLISPPSSCLHSTCNPSGLKNEIITPAESASITDDNNTLIFWIGLTVPKLNTSKCDQHASLFHLFVTFQTPITSDLLPDRDTVYYILKLQSRSSTHSLTMSTQAYQIHTHSTLNFEPL